MSTIGYVAVAAIGASVIFAWGMKVGHNDQKLFAQLEARAEMQARGVCGARAQLIKADGQYVCVYTNYAGDSVMRPALDFPLLGVISE